MKKFVFLAHGEMERTPEFQSAHRAWWSSIQGHVVDSGNPLFNGRNVTRQRTVMELTADQSPARLDVMYGWAPLRQSLACRAQGN